MTEEHQIATDDEKQDDLSSPVAESREDAILHWFIQVMQVENLADTTCHEIADSPEEKSYYEGRCYAWKQSAKFLKTIVDKLKASDGQP